MSLFALSGASAVHDRPGASEPSDALTALLATAARTANANEAALLRLETETAVVEASLGHPPPSSTIQLDGHARRAIENGGPTTLARAAWTAPGPQPSTGDASVSLLLVPLRIDGTLFGILAVGRQHDRPFVHGEVEGVGRLAGLGAVLLHSERSRSKDPSAGFVSRDSVNMVVHELRSPVTVIRGYLAMLRDGALGEFPAPATAVLDTLMNQAERLASIVDELPLLSSIDAQAADAHVRSLTCSDLLGRAQARSAGRAALAGASVTCHSRDGLAVLADARWADRILDNLVGNALAHGGGTPNVALTAESVGGDVVIIRVQDDGPGVPETLRDAVFERYVRGTSESSGSGLGLFISRGLARLMGGELILESSARSNGATFRLRLPSAEGFTSGPDA
jgi:two-component system phosphate regulon sensor histidine kinase PhoR